MQLMHQNILQIPDNGASEIFTTYNAMKKAEMEERKISEKREREGKI